MTDEQQRDRIYKALQFEARQARLLRDEAESALKLDAYHFHRGEASALNRAINIVTTILRVSALGEGE